MASATAIQILTEAQRWPRRCRTPLRRRCRDRADLYPPDRHVDRLFLRLYRRWLPCL